jgi:hypothetical protein
MRQGADRSGLVRGLLGANTFVAQVRSADRDKLLVQLVASILVPMLELPIFPRSWIRARSPMTGASW